MGSKSSIQDDRNGSNVSSFLAILLSITYSFLYVAILYVSPLTRPRANIDRNEPFVIRTRIRAVTVVTIFCILCTSTIIYLRTPRSWLDTLAFMGLSQITPSTLVDIGYTLLLTMVLFAGPLLEVAVVGVVDDDEHVGLTQALSSWVAWRNYVFAPLTEEVVFRACMVPLHLISGSSLTSIVFTTPLVFGIAHLHHAYEFLLRHPGHIKVACISSVVQFGYTTIFGWYVVFIFLRTGSVWPVFAVHAFCNYMGLPNFAPKQQRWLNVLYYPVLCGGAYAFYRLFWVLTESENSFAY